MTDNNERDGEQRRQPPAESAAADDQEQTVGAEDSSSGAGGPPAEDKADTGESGRGRGRGMAVAALILVLLLAVLTGLGGYWLWRQLGAASADQAQRAQAVAQQVERLVGRVDALRDDSGARSQTVGRLQARVEQLLSEQQALRQRIERIAGLAKATRENWRRSEAAYLASVAVHRLRFYRDVDSALAALKAADALLAGYGGESIGARKAIREAIDRLLAADPPDTAQIAGRLGELIGSLDTLPLAPQPPQRVAANGVENADDASSGWQARLSRAWQRFRAGLSELVVVSSERQVVPLTTREQRYFLRHNLRLELEAARRAALEGNGELYRSSVERVLSWAKRYLDSGQPAVAEFISALEALREQQVSVDLPDIAPVLKPVRQF